MTARLGEYKQAVEELFNETGEAKIREIAARLFVDKSSASKALARLVELGEIRTEAYGRNLTKYFPLSSPTRERVAELFREMRHRVDTLPEWLEEFKEVWSMSQSAPEKVYNVEVTVLVKGVKAVDDAQASRLALLSMRDGEVMHVDPYVEEDEEEDEDADR